MTWQFPVCQVLLIIEAHDHTQTHHTRYDSSGRVISPTQRTLPDNTQHSQESGIHALGRIPTHKPSKRATADPSLRPTGQWDRPALQEVKIFLGSHKDVNFPQIILSRETADHYSWVRNGNSPPLNEFKIYYSHAVTLTYPHIQINYNPSAVDLPIHSVALNFMHKFICTLVMRC
jgi:hypothetical protein